MAAFLKVATHTLMLRSFNQDSADSERKCTVAPMSAFLLKCAQLVHNTHIELRTFPPHENNVL